MAALPGYVKIRFAGYGHNRQSAVVRTETEGGLAKQLRTKSKVQVQRPVVMCILASDYDAFFVWFDTGINGGAGWFDFTDPRDAVVKQARIVEGKISSEKPTNGQLSKWDLSMTLETFE